jgi:peptidyl-prolyl cis-trans isomerase D
VEEAVRAAWIADAKRRAQEERAAALLAAVQAPGSGTTLAAAAAAAGLTSREVGGIRRDPQPGEAAAGVPRELLAPLFELPLNGTTMVRTRDGFAVAQVTEITRPDPAADAEALARLRREASQAIAQDLEVQFLSALREKADVRINPRLVEQLARP